MNDKSADLSVQRWDFGCYDANGSTLEISEDFIS